MSEVAAVMVPVAALKPWAGNPRKNDPAVDEVVASIKRFGFGAPIIARQENGEVICGHTRLKAAIRLKLASVPVRYLDLTAEEAHAYALADNKLGEIATWDQVPLADAFRELEKAQVDLSGLGWDGGELDRFLGRNIGAVEGDPFGSLPTGTPEFRTMTFTVSHRQFEIIEAALKSACTTPFTDTGNENRNGNALERICEAFHG